MWLTSVKDSRRLMSLCATAPRMPMIMVSSAATSSSGSSPPLGNSSECARMIAYTPTFVSRPANTAVTGAGARCHPVEPHRELRNVQRAGCGIDERDAEQEDQRRHHRNHHVGDASAN